MTPSTTRFAAVASLDVRPVDCYRVGEGLAASVRHSYAGLAAILDNLEGAPGRRLAAVLARTPEVLATAAGYGWLTATYGAIAGNDRPVLADLLLDFGRFEAAAAVAAGDDHDGAVPDRGVVALPGTGLVVEPSAGRLRVVAGTPEAPTWRTPLAGSLRVDGHEPLLSTPRSMSQFELAEPSIGLAASSVAELQAARELADVIVPGLFDRYLTEVVPLAAEPGIAHAGTDDAAPWTVYLSFGREPADLVAALAHEESHALVQTLAKLVPDLLPESAADMPVPWKPGVRRTLTGVLHGLIAFGRAATVRARAAENGNGSSANDAALVRERSWVATVTESLLTGSLGDLPAGLDEWLSANVAAIDGAAAPRGTDLTLLGRDGGEGADSRWRLVGGDGLQHAADELYPVALRSTWRRGVAGYPDQDRADLDAAAHPALVEQVPALLAREWGDQVELASVKVHRLRSGDSIRAHSDAEHEDLSHRLVLGLTPHDLDGGDLRLLTAEREATIATQPQFGQGLLFELAGPSLHEVTANRSPYPRYTLVASYRRRR